MVLDLSRSLLDVTFPGGGLTIAGFELSVIGPFREFLSLALIGDPSPINPSQVKADLEGLDTIELTTRYIGRLDTTGRQHGFLGQAPLRTRPPGPVDSFVSWEEDALITRERIPPLDLADVDEVEALLVWQLDNLSAPRLRFPL